MPPPATLALADPPAHAVIPKPSPHPLADPPEGTRVSEAEYWAYYYEHENAYEWNNGILEGKPVSDVLTFQIYQWLLNLFGFYLDTRPNARLTALEMGFRLSLAGKVAIRKPDLGLVRDTNPIPLQDLDRSYKGTFDLCVEALSDSTPAEIRRDTEQKRREYEAAGVSEYYILHHAPRWQLFYRRNALGLYEPIPQKDGIIGSSVLPGFQFRLADLLHRPGPEALIADPVYAPFVLPKWQQDRQARQQEREARQQAERRAEQAEQARQQAERCAEQTEQARQQEREARQQAERRAEQTEQARQQEREARQQAERCAEQTEQARQQEREARQQAERLTQQMQTEKAALLAELARLRGAV